MTGPTDTGESGFRELPHTADLCVELWAPTRAGLFLEGAKAIVHYLTEGADVAGVAERAVDLTCLDDDDALVRWLNHVLGVAVVDGFLVRDAQLNFSPSRVYGTARGEVDRAKVVCELKSVTYHDLLLRNEGSRWFARVVIDV